MTERGEHSAIAAPNADGGVGPRDGAATEIGTLEGESSSGRHTPGTEELLDTRREVGEEDGVACLSVRLLNAVCVCVFVLCVRCVCVSGCVRGCVRVGEKTSGELTKRTRREQKYT